MHSTRFYIDVFAITKDEYSENEFILLKLLHNGARGHRMVEGCRTG
jgi:hypothetical protein